jgi:RNA polymerase sigma-70 factor (ECF subfamily)
MPAPPTRPAAEDAVLVERLRGDETGEAMRALYRQYGGELYGFTLKALGDRGAAEEIVQEVFLRAWRNAGRYDSGRAAVRTWLYQITRNAIIDSRRRAAVRPGLPPHESVAEAEGGATLEQAMLGWQVAAALERLTPEHRQMIRMAQFRGLTMREIAEHTGLPLGTVKSRTWYALRSMRLVLEEMGVTPV